jgi:hypothetical protein
LASDPKDQARTDAALKKKELMARDASKAMAEYQAASKHMMENAARLRSLRLARDAAEAEARASKPAKAKKTKPARS